MVSPCPAQFTPAKRTGFPFASVMSDPLVEKGPGARTSLAKERHAKRRRDKNTKQQDQRLCGALIWYVK